MAWRVAAVVDHNEAIPAKAGKQSKAKQSKAKQSKQKVTTVYFYIIRSFNPHSNSQSEAVEHLDEFSSGDFGHGSVGAGYDR